MSSTADQVARSITSYDGIHAALIIEGSEQTYTARREEDDSPWRALLNAVVSITRRTDEKVIVHLPGRCRLDAIRSGETVLVVAREANHPIRKSANRLIRRGMRLLEGAAS